MRKFLAISSLIITFSSISLLFWYNEWKYNLPTPVPANYHAVKPGTIINMSPIKGVGYGKPVLLHFFNPDCPCSRFNIAHFKLLVRKYSNQVEFAVVVISTNKNYDTRSIQEKFNLDILVFFDRSIAVSCGVYSTPQAVIIDVDHKLYYRGNYNKSRYCVDPASNYTQMAIDSLLGHHYNMAFNGYAVKSYGCSLPNCSK